MKRIACALIVAAFALFAAPLGARAQNVWPTPGGSNADGKVAMCLNSSGQAVPVSSGTCAAGDLVQGNVGLTALYPSGATPITASATGTTAATTATLAAATSKTTYVCGFSIRANATAAATSEATVTGVITGTMSFLQWTAPLASGIGLVEERFLPCVPGSAANTGIAVVSAAPGSGGTVSVSAWGYQQ